MSCVEFCLTIQPLLREFTSELKLGFPDDVTLSGPHDRVVDDIQTYKIQTHKIWFGIEPHKYEVTYGDSSTPHDDPVLKVFHRVEIDDLTLLGAPIKPGRAVDKALIGKTKKMEKPMSRLQLLHSHDALILLRNSICVPKLLYTWHVGVQ